MKIKWERERIEGKGITLETSESRWQKTHHTSPEEKGTLDCEMCLLAYFYSWKTKNSEQKGPKELKSKWKQKG